MKLNPRVLLPILAIAAGLTFFIGPRDRTGRAAKHKSSGSSGKTAEAAEI